MPTTTRRRAVAVAPTIKPSPEYTPTPKDSSPLPTTTLLIGNSIVVTTSIPKHTFTVTHVDDDLYECTCPSWTVAAEVPKARTCRHLLKLLGGVYEEARLERTDGECFVTRSGPGRKRKAEEGEDGEKEVKKGKAVTFEQDDEDSDSSTSSSSDIPTAPTSPAAPVPTTTTSTKPARTSTRTITPTVNHATVKPLLAHKWEEDKGCDPTGMHMSEKLDGVRAIWHGPLNSFFSREGNPFYAPAWFTARLPRDHILDGELFTTRGGFQTCVSIVRTQNQPQRWKFSVTYEVFDVISLGSQVQFEKRLAWLESRFGTGVKKPIKWVNVVEHEVCTGKKHVMDRLDEICVAGGEGVMLREAKSLYVEGRSQTLLKVKRFHDADAVVRGHERGSGKNANVTGALRVEMLDSNGVPTGKMFKIGSGLKDSQRAKPPKIGAVVVYKYQQLSNSGTPRFPTFVGERADITVKTKAKQ